MKIRLQRQVSREFSPLVINVKTHPNVGGATLKLPNPEF